MNCFCNVVIPYILCQENQEAQTFVGKIAELARDSAESLTLREENG